MNTIRATLEVNEDGTIHLPLPPELRHGKLNVVAQVEPAVDEEAETARRERLVALMAEIRHSNPFKHIGDPLEWQRAMREDRHLPYPD
ncbi:MAG: hypothetical protein RLZZ303_52 [Candidatus Hydrogenedentota bacterium]|jgi:hypothetical protein